MTLPIVNQFTIFFVLIRLDSLATVLQRHTRLCHVTRSLVYCAKDAMFKLCFGLIAADGSQSMLLIEN